jgi:benzaldehyde dehydrogenase (NAD)
MVATAPEQTNPEQTSKQDDGWLTPFLAEWQTGTGEARDLREPATGRHLLTIKQSTPADVARAAAAAAAAQPAWAATNYQERAAVLRRAAEIYEQHRPEFGTWTQRETGAHRNKMHHEQNFTAGEAMAAAAMPWQPYGSLVPTVQQERLSMIRRIPVGVVGAITPWNSPSVLGMRVVAPALALGNAVVLKPDPQTPVCGGAVFAAIFREAGLPEGLLQIVIGDAETGQALITDPNINMVSFTGSTEVGRIVGAECGRLLKKVSLELGGNNPLVVLEDADLAAAASAGAYSSFQFQGQVCFATGRHIVHRSISDEYVDLLAQKARRLRTGDPYREDVELGPIVNEQQIRRVDDIVQRSVASGGARLVEGGTYDGLFYRPTVLADVKLDSPAWTDEIFGPVAPVVTFGSDDEAVELANATEYGLAAGVYSRSISRGLAVANRIKAGMVHVNDQSINDEATIPFGGMGISGNGGRFGSEANLEAFTQWQWVTIRDEARSFGPTY